MKLADAFIKIGFYRVKIVNGGIYRTKDSAIDFPADDLRGTRTNHDFRTVVVLSNDEHCQSLAEEVLVAPLSHNLHMKYATDVVIRASKDNGLAQDSRIILSHVQPILKSALEQFFGQFPAWEWETVVGHLLSNIDR